MEICRHFLVSGTVQGVFYRDSTQQKAQNLGLTGYVTNLSTGQVEIEVCGEESKLDELQEWLWKGPIMSKVEDIQFEDIATPNYSHNFSGFDIR